MSYNQGSPNPIQPLSVGNVVSAGFRLYRSHWQSYLQLAFIAYLWILVPFYGWWAKSPANMALISRLAFGELVNQPETVDSGRRFVNARLQQFFVMSLLMIAIAVGLFIVFLIPFSILTGIFTTFIVAGVTSGSTPNPAIVIAMLLLILLLIPVVLVAVLWIQARFLLIEVPLAVEENIDGSATVSRSWELTKGNVWRIVGILFVAYLITLPIQLPFNILSVILQGIIESSVENNPNYILPLVFVRLIILLVGAAIVVPFWQSIKAVIYYDLRSRREGLGLKLRDYDI
jgi:hypothetical protein